MKRFVCAILILLSNTNFLFSQFVDGIFNQKIDALLDSAYSKGIFSGVVLITHHGQEEYFKTIGYSDWNTKKVIDRNTLFNIGSLNKQFTEEMIHQLVKEKKLGYDDPLSKYLNLFPIEIGNKITIQQLLDMKSGLGDYLQNPRFDQIRFTNFSLENLLDIIKTEPLRFEPGTNQEYSNSGYVVLGGLIEKVTGKTYEENLKDRIVKPVGIKNLFYTKDQKANAVNRAFGTDLDFEGTKKSIDDISNSSPAGEAYMSVSDMMTFTLAKLHSSLPSGKKYGRGSFSGGTPIWNSSISYNETSGYAYVVMANMGKIADELTPRIGAILKNEPFPPLELPLIMKFYQIFKNNGISYIKDNIKMLAQQSRLPYDARFLNFIGYQFLNSGRTDIAVEIFRINTELFQDNANVYDSLAEAYLRFNDKSNALKFYKKAFALDPKNSRLVKTIKSLESSGK